MFTMFCKAVSKLCGIPVNKWTGRELALVQWHYDRHNAPACASSDVFGV